jgi:hypothetical protein
MLQFNRCYNIFGLFLAGMPLRRKITWICLGILAIAIKILSLSPRAVENYYATGFYPVISRLQRLLFGWIPFSVGDLVYLFVAIWLLYRLVNLIRRLIRREVNKAWLWTACRRIIFALLLIYVLFNGLWGLNYDRRGIASQLQLNVQPYSTPELARLLTLVCVRLNTLDSLGGLASAGAVPSRALFTGAVRSYDSLAARDPRFAYSFPSIKSSLYGYLNDYLGFGGYYNPFTGEAQVNTTLPELEQPFTACHEMGHQLGYAKENEANFSGYLSARSSADPAFRFSVYADLYLYAARELYVRDSNLVRPLRDHLRPFVRQYFREVARFNRRFENPFEPVVRGLYGNYLRANSQPQGIMTYNEVVAWLIAYAKKNGWEDI